MDTLNQVPINQNPAITDILAKMGNLELLYGQFINLHINLPPTSEESNSTAALASTKIMKQDHYLFTSIYSDIKRKINDVALDDMQARQFTIWRITESVKAVEEYFSSFNHQFDGTPAIYALIHQMNTAFLEIKQKLNAVGLLALPEPNSTLSLNQAGGGRSKRALEYPSTTEYEEGSTVAKIRHFT